MPSLIFNINFSFVYLFRSRGGEGWLIFFHARCVILKMSVYSLVIAREYVKGIRDAQSRNAKINEITLCCQIINSLESVGMEGTRGYD